MKYAINIALIPEKKVYDYSIDLFKILEKQHPQKYILGKNAIPHITLVHTTVDENNLEDLSKIIKNISESTKKLNLVLDKIFLGPKSGSFWLCTKRDENIFNLHKLISHQIKNIVSNKYLEKSMFAFPDEIGPEVDWVKSYFETAALDNYNPHITIGIGKVENVSLPIDFIANKIGIY